MGFFSNAIGWRKDFTIGIFLASLSALTAIVIPFLTIIVPTNLMILEGEGFRAEFNFQVTPINRYQKINGGYIGNLYSGYLAPRSSMINNSYDVYLEDFEGGSTIWVQSGGAGYILPSLKYAYNGTKSYSWVIPKNGLATLTLTQNFTFPDNETGDIFFYTEYFPRTKAITNGYYAFTTNFTYYNGTNFVDRSITQIIQQVGATTYPSTDPNEMIINSNAIPMTYTGYMINNIRNVTANYFVDEMALLGNFTITSMQFKVLNVDRITQILIDYIKIQKYPKDFQNVWYEGYIPRTDYIINCSYTLWIDTDIILDLTTASIKFDVFEFIDGSVMDRAEMLIDSLIQSNMTYEASVLGQYDVKTMGNWTSIMHRLPLSNPYGDLMTYTFNANVTAWAYLPDLSTTVDSLRKPLTGENFTVNYLSPIDLQ